MKQSLEDAPCEVWPSNWKTVQIMLALGTQWRIGMGGATGLDYAVLPLVAKKLGIRLTPARFAGVQIMEGEALRVMSARSSAA